MLTVNTNTDANCTFNDNYDCNDNDDIDFDIGVYCEVQSELRLLKNCQNLFISKRISTRK